MDDKSGLRFPPGGARGGGGGGPPPPPAPQQRQRDPERTKGRILDAALDPAALLLIILGAANALTVYPHIARGLFSTPDGHAPELVAHYAAQLAKVVGRLGPTHAAPPPCAADRPALEPDGSR
jgi:hypothetical protein